MELIGLKRTPAWFVRAMILLAVFLAINAALCSGRVLAQDLGKPLILVAAPHLQGGYAGTVIHVVPFMDGHVGLVLNRPSTAKVGDLFPEHEPSKAVVDFVYRGGPIAQSALIAVVKADGARSPSSVELMPGVWLETSAKIVDAIIESTPNAARYFVGFVAWRPGELQLELRRGLFTVRKADASVFFRDTSGLWMELEPRDKGLVDS